MAAYLSMTSLVFQYVKTITHDAMLPLMTNLPVRAITCKVKHPKLGSVCTLFSFIL